MHERIIPVVDSVDFGKHMNNPNPISKLLDWAESEFLNIDSERKSEDIPVVSRQDFGKHIDNYNSLIRLMIHNFLITHAVEHFPYQSDSVRLKDLELAFLRGVQLSSVFMTEYNNEKSYYFVSGISFADLNAVEPFDRIKIVWSRHWSRHWSQPHWKSHAIVNTSVDSQLANEHEVCREVYKYYYAKLVNKKTIGFVIYSAETNYDGAVEDLDYVDLEEAADYEANADPLAPMDWVRHAAYLAMKMMIS